MNYQRQLCANSRASLLLNHLSLAYHLKRFNCNRNSPFPLCLPHEWFHVVNPAWALVLEVPEHKHLWLCHMIAITASVLPQARYTFIDERELGSVPTSHQKNCVTTDLSQKLPNPYGEKHIYTFTNWITFWKWLNLNLNL